MTDTTGTVCLAYVHANEVAHSWHLSTMDLLMYDAAHAQRIVRGGFLAMRCGTGGLIAARNEVAATFLKRDAEWLWWVDTDMGFTADTVDRLVAAADPVDRPIVGGLCFAQHEYATDGLGGFRTRPRPTLYRWANLDGQSGLAVWEDYPRDELVEVSATGSACILIHRTVLEKIASTYGPVWYSRVQNPDTGQLLAEDLSFCMRALELGFRVHVDTRVKTSHLKPIWLAEDDYLAARRG